MSTTARLAFIPRDGIFCKDGRGWFTSSTGRGHGLDWPWPSTLLGALRTAWGRGEEARTSSLFSREDWRTRTAAIHLGKAIALRRAHGEAWREDHAMWPVAADAQWLDKGGAVRRLEPVERATRTLGRDDDDAREALRWPSSDDAQKPIAPPRWWTSDELTTWLAGGALLARSADSKLATVRRRQVHVSIHADTMTADDGKLFSHDVVETFDATSEWAIGVEAELPNEAVLRTATVGSDSRVARVESLPATIFEPPVRVLEAFRARSRGLRLMAATPLCFRNGWLPDGMESSDGVYRGALPGVAGDVVLRAAFVARPLAISGWDMADSKPKPTSRMVAPGAVYFFERASGEPFDEGDAHALWLAPFGARTDAGFGRVVPGTWSPTRSTR